MLTPSHELAAPGGIDGLMGGPRHQRIGDRQDDENQANYLYRVLGDLAKEGRVKKKGRQYHPGG